MLSQLHVIARLEQVKDLQREAEVDRLYEQAMAGEERARRPLRRALDGLGRALVAAGESLQRHGLPPETTLLRQTSEAPYRPC